MHRIGAINARNVRNVYRDFMKRGLGLAPTEPAPAEPALKSRL